MTPRRDERKGSDAGDRYEPMPSFAALPSWLWRRAPRPARVAAVLLACAAAVAVVLLLGLGERGREQGRRDAADYRSRAKARLRADQAPRHGTAASVRSLRADLTLAIGADVARRFPRAGTPETACRRVRPVSRAGEPLPLPAADAYFKCFATQATKQTRAARLQTGYAYRARANLETLELAWCKLNPRPIHADQEEFIHVELSPECVPPVG